MNWDSDNRLEIALSIQLQTAYFIKDDQQENE